MSEYHIPCIYQIRNIVTDKVYIGRAKRFLKRKSEHIRHLESGKHHSQYLQRSYDKHGRDSFVFEIVELCLEHELISREQYYLDLYIFSDRWDETYNVSKSALGTEGYKFSEESKQRLSEQRRGENNSFYGKKHSEETRKKISIAATGRKPSKEARKKMGDSRRGEKNHFYNKIPEKAVAKIRKPVAKIDKDTGEILEVFNSLTEAGKSLGKKPATICQACKEPHRTAYGFKWRYTD